MVELLAQKKNLLAANVRLCRLRLWPESKYFGFYIRERNNPPQIVTLIESNSPAAATGLKIMDAILMINNTHVSDEQYKKVEDLITAAITNDGYLEMLVVEHRYFKTIKGLKSKIPSHCITIFETPKSRPPEYQQNPDYAPRICEIKLENTTVPIGLQMISGVNLCGVYVQEVTPNSLASLAGLRKSDRIIEINDSYVDKDPIAIFQKKFNEALLSKNIKLLVADTKAYAYGVLHQTYAELSGEVKAPKKETSNSLPVESIEISAKPNSSSEDLSQWDGSQDINTQNTTQNHGKLSETKQLDNRKSKGLLSFLPLMRTPKIVKKNQRINRSASDDPVIMNCTKTAASTLQRSVLDQRTSPVMRELDCVLKQTRSLKSKQLIDSSDDLQTKSTSSSNPSNSLVSEYDEIEDEYRYAHIPDDDVLLSERFNDVQFEPLIDLPPIEALEDIPILSLTEIANQLKPMVKDIKHFATMAMKKTGHRSSEVDDNESACIALLRMKWTNSISSHLNRALRSDSRVELKPFFHILKLLFVAISKLPSLKTTAWRGSTEDLRSKYPIDKIFTWQGFSFCVGSRLLLESEPFFKKNAPHTLFHIDCEHGKLIFSSNITDGHIEEILLLPETTFKVIKHTEVNDELCIIHLQEIKMELVFPVSPVEISSEKNVLDKTVQKKRAVPKPTLWSKDGTTLQFSDSHLTAEEIQWLIDQLKTNEHWCTVSLQSSLIDENEMETFMTAVVSNSIITELCLRRINFNDSMISILAESLKTNVTIKTLDMSENQITTIGCQYLADLFSSNKTITSLKFSSDELDDKDGALIVHSLRLNDVSPQNGQDLDTKSDNETSDEDTDAYIINLDGTYLDIENVINHSRSFNVLDFSRNKLGNCFCQEIEFLLTSPHCQIVELNLSNNPLNDLCIKSIMSGLVDNMHLTTLHLNEIEITTEGVARIAEIIRKNKKITYLALMKNRIDDEQMILISRALAQNTILHTIDLRSNQLTDYSAYELVTNIKLGSQLHEIRLDDNMLTRSGTALVQNVINERCSCSK